MDGRRLSLCLERKQLLGRVIQISTFITIVKVTQEVSSAPSQSFAATDIQDMAVCVGNYVNTLRFWNIGAKKRFTNFGFVEFFHGLRGLSLNEKG
jgi:hypothetical protein